MNRRDFLFAPILLSACARKQATSVHIDPALSTLIPADTTLLAGLKLDKLQPTPVFQKYFANRPLPGLQDFTERTGVDPRRDLYELLLASNGRELVAMVRGKFGDAFGKAPRFNLQGATTTEYKGVTLLGNAQQQVAFMNSSVAVAGPPAALRRVIDQRDSKTAGPPATLLARTETVPPDNQVWALTLPGTRPLALLMPRGGNAGNFTKLYESLDSFTAYADLRQGLNFTLEGFCPNEEESKRLTETVNAFVGIGRLSTPNNKPDLLELYDHLKVNQKAKSVVITAFLPERLVEAALQSLPFGPL